MNNQNGVNEQRAEKLMTSITFYTAQLEDYDKCNFNACMTCIGFVGGLIAVVAAILCASSDRNNPFLNESIAILLLLIPAIITLFLYHFSMNCRRSALYRGYVQFLENQLNELTKSYDMLFSSYLTPNYYTKFAVNYYGPLALMIFLMIIFALCFIISFIFARKSSIQIFLSWYTIGAVVFGVLCLIFNLMYVHSLIVNADVIKETMLQCEEEYQNKSAIIKQNNDSNKK